MYPRSSCAKREHLRLIRCFGHQVLDVLGIVRRSRPLEKSRTKVGGHDPGAEGGQAARPHSIAICHVQHEFAGPQPKKAFGRGSDEDTLKLVAVARALIPEFGFALPECQSLSIETVTIVVGAKMRDNTCNRNIDGLKAWTTGGHATADVPRAWGIGGQTTIAIETSTA